MTVTQFRKRSGNPKNGACCAIASDLVDYDYGGKEIVVSTDFAVIHMSASGDSAGYSGGFATMAEAEAAARLEALRRDCVLIPGRGA